MSRRYGKTIELSNTRSTSRRGITKIEQKPWFWYTLYALTFVGTAVSMFYLASSLRFPFSLDQLRSNLNPRTVATGLIPAIITVYLCSVIHRCRLAEFANYRSEARVARREREIDRFIVELLRGLRIPVKSIKKHSQTILHNTAKLSTCCSYVEIPTIEHSTSINPETEKNIAETAQRISHLAESLDALPRGLLKIGRIRKAIPYLKWLDTNSIIIDTAQKVKEELPNISAVIEKSDLPNCFADEEMVAELFYELIHNAVRYTENVPKKRVRIYGHIERGMANYSIEDTGIGIEPKKIEKIFEMFYRGVPNRVLGEGLGLTIVKRIVEQHNGRIWLKSTPNYGTIFTIALPIK